MKKERNKLVTVAERERLVEKQKTKGREIDRKINL